MRRRRRACRGRAAPGGPQAQPLDEIGIGNERLAEGDEVGAAFAQGLDGEFAGIAVVGDIGAAEGAAQRGVVERRDIAVAARRALDDVNISEAPLAQPRHEITEQGGGIGVGDVVGGAHRREPDADARGWPDLEDGLDDFEREARAAFDRAAVGILALVGAVAQELVDEIAVGGVDFDAVEAGALGVAGGLRVVLEDRRDLGRAERPRLGDVGESRSDKRLGLGPDRRGRDRRAAVRLQRRVRDAPHVPKLRENAPARLVRRLCHVAPAFDLRLAVEARRPDVALALLADLRRLGDDQPGARALAVIGRGEFVRRVGSVGGAVARQRRHHDAIGQLEIAEPEGPKQHCGIEVHGNAFLLEKSP